MLAIDPDAALLALRGRHDSAARLLPHGSCAEQDIKSRVEHNFISGHKHPAQNRTAFAEQHQNLPSPASAALQLQVEAGAACSVVTTCHGGQSPMPESQYNVRHPGF